jgi:dual specificity tyrosine-phosphorylation-regulated kinase 2/3/4
MPPSSGFAPRPLSLSSNVRPQTSLSDQCLLIPHLLTSDARIGTLLSNRYQILSLAGRGAFSVVLRVFDKATSTEAVVKVISEPENSSEVAINKTISGLTDSIAEFKDSFFHKSDLCLVFEVLGRPLSSVLACRRMTETEIRAIARDLFTALACLHAKNLVHCDVKPENILFRLGLKDRVKLIDFGTSCFVGEAPFEYFQSRFYRAPEAILGLPFVCELDIWSSGCVLAEMALGNPLFPGKSEEEQIVKFVELIGMPPEGMRGRVTRDLGRKRHRRQLKRRIEDQELVDLIGKCVVWDPGKRVKAEDALKHPFFVRGE